MYMDDCGLSFFCRYFVWLIVWVCFGLFLICGLMGGLLGGGELVVSFHV